MGPLFFWSEAVDENNMPQIRQLPEYPWSQRPCYRHGHFQRQSFVN
jgi:hypothetical protein